ncbi:MAG: hypothetical protein AAF348_04630 [Bacteroidota bacterium]
MRFFKVKTINWKYIFGEIFLIFVGINLAIWFNDWNSSKSIKSNKKIALNKIEGEIKNNLEQLLNNREHNQKIASFLKEVKEIREKESGKLFGTPDFMQNFEKKYKDIIEITDSTRIENGIYAYEGDSFVSLEIAEPNRIAWETSKSSGIFQEFGYECLYGLEGIYNSQKTLQNEIDKAVEALRNESMDELRRILGFLDQLEVQLEADYREMLEGLDNCR